MPFRLLAFWVYPTRIPRSCKTLILHYLEDPWAQA